MRQPDAATKLLARRPQSLSERQVDDLIRLRKDGWRVKDLAAYFHRDTVHRHLKRNGLAPASGELITGARLDDVASRYAAGESCATIATDIEVDPSTIANTLRRAGISLRQRKAGA